MRHPFPQLIAVMIVVAAVFAVLMAASILTGRLTGQARLQQIEAVLRGEECALPCFMGIPTDMNRLGYEQIALVLENHPYVKSVSVESASYSYMTISWEWSGTQPPFIDASRPGEIRYDNANGFHSIYIPTVLRAHDLYRLFGESDFGGTFARRDALQYNVEYPALRLSIAARLPCPATLMDYWEASASLVLRSFIMGNDTQPITAIPLLCTEG
jgi:hypothetical protein